MIARCLLLLMLSVAPIKVFGASATVGTITVQDHAPGKIQRQNSWIPAVKGTGVEMQDAVDTMNGKLLITFRDDTQVEVNEQSRLEIDEFVFDPSQPSTGKLAMNFAQGTVRYASGAIAHNNPANVSINTPTATVAVRGTDFTATVDELGSSTIILLPSCPAGYRDVDKDCKTGMIDVSNSAGSVTLSKPFQGTVVVGANQPPTAPVTLHLSYNTINNLLIISPPPEINAAIQAASLSKNATDNDLLDEKFLENIFALIGNPLLNNTANNQAVAEHDTQTETELQKRLPDWKKATGVIPTLSPAEIDLCRSSPGSNVQCLHVPLTQNTNVIQNQGSTDITNRVNSGGNTNIILRQN